MLALAPPVVALPDPTVSWSMRRHLAHLSDEALVALVARGDEAALAELYDRVGRIAYGLAFRVLRDDRLAEDAVQEAFLGVWRTAAGFRAERAKASTWILTLVHRRAVDLVRREERRRAEPLDETVRETTSGETAEDVGVARVRARARAGRTEAAAGHAARGDRARLLRGLFPVGAGREARNAARYDQEQDVRRARALARAPRRRSRGRVMEAEIHELTAGYALDALDPAEREEYERHLASCERCQEELASFWEVTGALAVAAAGPAPSPALRERILESARSETQMVVPFESRRQRLSPCSRASPRSRRRSRSGSASTRCRSSNDLDETRAALTAQEQAAAVLADPDASTVELAAGTGRLVVADGGDAVLVLDDLDAAPDGKTYQAWVVEGQTPRLGRDLRRGGRAGGRRRSRCRCRTAPSSR